MAQEEVGLSTGTTTGCRYGNGGRHMRVFDYLPHLSRTHTAR